VISRLLGFIFGLLLMLPASAIAQTVLPGAYLMEDYLPTLKDRRVALLVNQTSRVGNQNLADTLLKRGVNIVKVFTPEHGFRGTADAGAHVDNTRDSATGLALISLYGDHKKPTAADLNSIDIVVYDLQDVGARFYTYISTLQYVMEACAEQSKALLILDRPNPNGDYIDGPVLDTSMRSFVGMQPIPIVYGMTPAEYAKMLVGENWFKNADKLNMEFIRCRNWTHSTPYSLPVAPSPNLRRDRAIRLYPTLCLFEGTVISVGRGTDKPFQQWGNPELNGKFQDSFTPQSTTGASHPPFEGQTCYGRISQAGTMIPAKIDIHYLIEMYQSYPKRDAFFNAFFEKLSGTKELRKQIVAGMSAAAIEKSWEPGLKKFKAIRSKYLLYPER
jgi:uncharacterized protein YbbC (DUF1343 family)